MVDTWYSCFLPPPVATLTPIIPFTSAEKFEVVSDGPVIRDAPITFYAKLENPERESYTIAWQENYPNEGTYKVSKYALLLNFQVFTVY
jgi:hypothetical protein